MMNMLDFYNKMPVIIQNVGCSIIGLKIYCERYNKLFWRYLREAEERQTWSYDHLCEFRDSRLRKLVLYAAENVPYYNKMFSELGLNPGSVRRLDDLKKLPIIDKQLIKQNFEDFISVKKETRVGKFHTSGSTGSGFIFYMNQSALIRQWASFWRWYRSIGIEKSEWCMHFSGRTIVPQNINKPPFYRVNYPTKQYFFSGYHMNDNNLKFYIEELIDKKIRWIHGYPSNIVTFAQYVNNNNIKLSGQVKWITCGSENLYDYQREIIYQAFGVYPLQNYAQTECVATFTEKLPKELYVVEDQAAVEFIDVEGDGRKRVVGTNLWNYYMPFIRYDTHDIASAKESLEGRFIENLDGRLEDYIILSNGSKIGRMDVLFKDIKNIQSLQLVQRKAGKVDVYIVKHPDYSKKETDLIIKEFQEHFGNKLVPNIEFVESILPGKNGKHRMVINKMR